MSDQLFTLSLGKTLAGPRGWSRHLVKNATLCLLQESNCVSSVTQTVTTYYTDWAVVAQEDTTAFDNMFFQGPEFKPQTAPSFEFM